MTIVFIKVHKEFAFINSIQILTSYDNWLVKAKTLIYCRICRKCMEVKSHRRSPLSMISLPPPFYCFILPPPPIYMKKGKICKKKLQIISSILKIGCRH